jgi:tRNA (guanosine-2'-O-)-methyltransferase
MKEKLIRHLEQFVTDRRLRLFDKVLVNRTRYITVVLEDIFQPHNASAVLRSCECFGIQDVHIIENRNKYQVNPDVTLGANKWLTLFRYNRQPENTKIALETLKKKGYRIVATTLHHLDCPLDAFELEKGKAALVFGTELEGLSHVALDHADEFVRIPTAGFTESLNISVSVAIMLHYLTTQLHNSRINWHLGDQEKQTLKLQWLKKSIRKAEEIERSFLGNRQARNDGGSINSATPSE